MVMEVEDINLELNGLKYLCKTTNYIDLVFSKEALMKIVNDFQELSKCKGNCGMNYCDENGCIERKRVLTDDSIFNCGVYKAINEDPQAKGYASLDDGITFRSGTVDSTQDGGFTIAID